jgi:hypothetical protein
MSQESFARCSSPSGVAEKISPLTDRQTLLIIVSVMTGFYVIIN